MLFPVDPNFLFDLQMLNNIFKYRIPKSIKFGPIHVAPQPLNHSNSNYEKTEWSTRYPEFQ